MASPDDDLTQRERRAQRHKSSRRTGMSDSMSRSMKTWAPVALIAVVVLAAGYGVYKLNESVTSDCVDGHWHATFGIFLPGKDGAPERVDFLSPKTPNGLHYYDYNSVGQGGDAQFSPALHMHESGTELVADQYGPAQWHMEQPGKCVTVKQALHIVEADADSSSLNLWGAHEQVPGQSGTFSTNETSQMRFWVETHDGCNAWGWHEWTWNQVKGHQMQWGESLLVALGHYTPEQVTTMQAQIPVPQDSPTGAAQGNVHGVEKCGVTSSSSAPTSVPSSGSTSSGSTGNATAPPA